MHDRYVWRIASLLLLACGSVCAGQAAPQCSVPPGNEPWRDASQTPQCRTLEVVRSMSLNEKLDRLDGTNHSFLELHAADGPNGIARGPFPGPPKPMASGN